MSRMMMIIIIIIIHYYSSSSSPPIIIDHLPLTVITWNVHIQFKVSRNIFRQNLAIDLHVYQSTETMIVMMMMMKIITIIVIYGLASS